MLLLPVKKDTIAEIFKYSSISTTKSYFFISTKINLRIENGFNFIGKSKICDPKGKVLTEAQNTSESILYADVDVELARTKRIVRIPNKLIIDRIADRRPEFYGRVSEPKLIK